MKNLLKQETIFFMPYLFYPNFLILDINLVKEHVFGLFKGRQYGNFLV